MKYKAVSSYIALIITLIIVMIGVIKQELLQYDFSFNKIKSENEVIAMSSVDYSLTDDINNFVNNNYDIFKFYADTFEINIEDIKNELILSNANKVFNSYDIANSGITYASLDKNLIDYLFDLEELKPNLFQKKHYDGNKYSKEYIYSLLKYYTNIYDDVDYRTLAGITYIETGNLSSQSMLKYNNIFGAMNNGNLINYKNMSYGILTYVKLMNDKYYGQGLNTLESIGQKFNPVINKYGKKIANPNWVSDIKSVLNKIDSNISTKTILELNSIK